MWPVSFKQQWNGYPVVAPGEQEERWVKVFDALFPGCMGPMAHTPQDPIHHAEGDVWTHTKMVVNEMLNNPLYSSVGEGERQILWTAAALHDITKPYTTKVDEQTGRVTAAGHSRSGGAWARFDLWLKDVPRGGRDMVSTLIRYHQSPFYAFSQRDQATADFLARKISIDCSIEMLVALAQSDMRGRVCADQQTTLDNIEVFGLVAQELGCWDTPYAFPDSTTQSRYVLAHGQRDPDTPVYTNDMFEVVVLSGPPASGKDTWCALHGNGLPVVSYDAMREEKGYKHGQHTGEIVHAVHDLARSYLREKVPFIWNATHLTENMRGPALSLIRQYGGSPTIVCLEAPASQLKERNHKRNSSLDNAKLMEMVRKWERPWGWEADRVRDDSQLLQMAPSKRVRP